MSSRFIHSDLLKIFPYINPRTLISWSERGLIKPDLLDSSGRGSSRVYSYSNLIEIGIVFELLRLGLPFSMIAAIMGSDAVMGLRNTKDFDVVLWTYRQAPDTTTNPPPSHNDPQKKAAPSSIRVPLPTVTARGAQVGPTQCARVEDFLADGGRLMLGGAAGDVSSILVVNVKGIKDLIDRQIRRLK